MKRYSTSLIISSVRHPVVSNSFETPWTAATPGFPVQHANYQRNANQNYEMPPNIGQNGHHQKIYKQELERVWRKG